MCTIELPGLKLLGKFFLRVLMPPIRYTVKFYCCILLVFLDILKNLFHNHVKSLHGLKNQVKARYIFKSLASIPTCPLECLIGIYFNPFFILNVVLIYFTD